MQRAFKTAEAIRSAQLTSGGEHAKELAVTQVPDLIEQDFGFYEGKTFYARQGDKNKTGREAHYDTHKDEPGFVDVESKQSMARRADTFLNKHLLPLFEHHEASTGLAVAIVSHGILLSNLWRRLLLRLPRKSLNIAPEITAARGHIILEHLGGWSNTGYLELSICKDSMTKDSNKASKERRNSHGAGYDACGMISAVDGSAANTENTHLETVTGSDPLSAASDAGTLADVVPQASPTQTVLMRGPYEAPEPSLKPHDLSGWSTTIAAIDSKQHLVGLKRQRGGIGRLKHDEGQKTLDSFFKRQKKV